MDGWITIGTKLDTTKFDHKVSNLENKIDSAEKKQELINQKTAQYKEDLKQVSSEVDDLAQQYEKASAEAERLRQIIKTSGAGSYQGFQANLEYQEQVKQVDKLSSELTKAEIKQQNLTNKVAQSNLQYENSVKQVNTLRGKLQQLNVKQAQSQFEDVNKSIQNMQKGLTNSVAKVGKLALGVFSVYSAYRLASSASATLAQYDEQYASNLEYIRFALAQGIASTLKGLVNLAGQLLSYLNYILSAWFGINLFSNASAKAFQNMSAGAKSTAKSAKEIKNQLAGFDEMNVLSSTDTSNSAGGTGVGAVMPSFDVSGIQGEVPSWLKWIADNKDIILSTLAGIAGGLVAIKFGVKALTALGIGIVIKGLLDTIKSIVKFIKNPSWKNFSDTLSGLSKILAGIAIIMISINSANPLGWIILVISAVTALVSVIIKNWDSIVGFLSETWENIKQTASDIWNAIANFFKDLLEGIATTILNVWNGILDTITTVIQTIKNVITNTFTNIYNTLNTIWNNVKNTVVEVWDTVTTKIKDGVAGAWEAITSVFGNIANWFRDKFTEAWQAVKNVFSSGGQIFDGIKDGILSGLKAVINAIITGINKVIAIPFNGINTALRKIRDVNILGVTPFTWIQTIGVPQIPKLKTGGIINYPNRGVMLGGSAIAGEAGAEGVIPLTDSQAMAQLGEAIGKYITINATVINKMNSRTLSRQMQTIQANKDFAYNL